jgi:ribonuclease BN (tRNA processing enzyme)
MPIPVNHSVPTVGFLLREGSRSVLYSGDTYLTDEIWHIASQDPTLKAAFIETSLPNEMADLAFASRHLTPSLLMKEIRKLNRFDIPLYIYHVKPSHAAVIGSQRRDLHLPHLTILQEGQSITV